jgi:glycosyltransferase involved in cell wall biosynthesis
MNILFVSSYFLPYTSGAITSPAEVLRHFVSQGHDVTVLTFKYDASLPDTDEYDGIRVRRLPYGLRINKGFISFTYPFRTFHEFRRAEVVIFNQPVFEGLFVIGTARLAGKRIMSLVNCQVTLGSGLKNRVLTTFLNMSMSIQLELSHTIVTYTQDYAENTPLLRRYGYKTRYIPPLVPMQPGSESFKTVLENRKHNDIWVAFCGRISSEKGLEHLVHACTHLEMLRNGDDLKSANFRARYSGDDSDETENDAVSSTIGRRIVLVFAGPYGREVVGEAWYYEKIRQLCKTLNVPHFFTGYLSSQELGAFFDVMDCLVLPSVNGTESFGIVQVEAMRHGKPVVASNLPGVRVPIESSRMGLISHPGDSEDIARCIHSVLNNSDFTALENRRKIDMLMNTGQICDAWDACIAPNTREMNHEDTKNGQKRS